MSTGGDPHVVLFVCVQNAGRSQMAAALLERYAGDRLRILSAGSAPAASVHPEVAEALRDVGIELGRATPRLLAEADVREADVVVTMGCGDACPVYPGKRYEDWEIEDPAGKPPQAVQRIRDEIDARVRRLADSL